MTEGQSILIAQLPAQYEACRIRSYVAGLDLNSWSNSLPFLSSSCSELCMLTRHNCL